MGLGGIRIGGGRPPEDDFYFKNGVPVRLKTVRGFTPKEERIAKAYMQSLEDGRRTGIYDSAIASRYDRMMRERDPENYGFLPLPGGKGIFSKREANRDPQAFKAAQNAAIRQIDIDKFGYDASAFNKFLGALEFDGIDNNDIEKIRQYIQQSILGGTMTVDVGQRLASQYGINSNLIGT